MARSPKLALRDVAVNGPNATATYMMAVGPFYELSFQEGGVDNVPVQLEADNGTRTLTVIDATTGDVIFTLTFTTLNPWP